MCISKFLFIFISVHLCQGSFRRDLLLTPREGLQIHGRRIYYRPGINETTGSIPWEQTLKHVTFLTLFPNSEGDDKIRDIGKYEKFMQSTYTRLPKDYPKFGDVITMAEGWLQKSNGYRFIEGTCDRHCGEAALALWKVQKIRHRDPERGFRYEMKISVTPLTDSTAKHGDQYLKSFILKDDDYPESFNALTRRSDVVEIFSNERQARIVNEHPGIRNLNSPQLNIGEYFKNIPQASSKVGHLSEAYDVHPTTYRPNYQIKFPKPETHEQLPEEPKTVVTHHFHHHFFMNEPEAHLLHEQAKFLVNAEAIHIIDAPKMDILAQQYGRFQTTTPPPPSTVSYMHTVPIFRQTSHPDEPTSQQQPTTPPPPSAVSYMHTVPIFKQISHQDDPTAQHQRTPFKQSEQQVETIRYSDPDPLYENEGLGSLGVNSETASAEVYPQVERPQTIAEPPQIIPDQANPEETSEDMVVEELEENTTTRPTLRPTREFTKTEILNLTTTSKPRVYASKVYNVTTTPKPRGYASKAYNVTTPKPRGLASKVYISKFRSYPRATTEQHVLKWKPKRKQTEKTPEQQSNESTQEDGVVTVTPSNAFETEYEILTEKSVSKSVSVKIGNYSQELPLTEASKTTTEA